MNKSIINKLNQAAKDIEVPSKWKGKQKGEYFKLGALEMLDKIAGQFGMRVDRKAHYRAAMHLKP